MAEQEIYDIFSVKTEYLAGVVPALTQQFNTQALEAAFMVLHDFCTTIRANNLLLIRIQEQSPIRQSQLPPHINEPNMQPQSFMPRRMPEPEYNNDTYEEERQLKAEYMRKIEEDNRNIQVDDMRKRVEQLNTELKQPQSGMVFRDNIAMEQEKPKPFTERIKQFKVERQDNINPEED